MNRTPIALRWVTLAGLAVGACLSNDAPDKLAPVGSGMSGSASSGNGGGSAGAPAGGGSLASGGQPADTGGSALVGGGGDSDEPAQGGAAGEWQEPPLVIDTSKRQIVSVDGHVTRSTNGFGIDGDWSAFNAPTATVTADFTGLQVCATASYPKVPNNTLWDTYWGGGLALTLRSDNKGLALPYDAPAHEFAGLELTVTGKVIPHEIRLKYKQIGLNDSFCKVFFDVKSGDRLTVRVDEVTHDCWNAGGAHVNAKNLEHFELHVWPELAADVAMDLCLTDITVIPTETSGAGGAGGAGGNNTGGAAGEAAGGAAGDAAGGALGVAGGGSEP